jgi:hypothetical protein
VLAGSRLVKVPAFVLMREIEYQLAGCGANLFGRVVSQFEFLMGFIFCVGCFSSHLCIIE